MKKLVLSFALIAGLVTVVSAQSRLGIQAGIAMASMKGEEGGEEQKLDSKIGLTIGVTTDVSLSDNFRFRPALNFTQKGGKDEFDFMGTTVKSTINLNYLELPLNFVYSANAGSGRFVIGAGPALAFGLSGQTKVKADGEEEKDDIKFGNADDEFKSFEFSGNFLAGFELANGVFIHLNYNKGFSNLSNSSDAEAKNSYFGVRLGYFLGGNK